MISIGVDGAAISPCGDAASSARSQRHGTVCDAVARIADLVGLEHAPRHLAPDQVYRGLPM